LSPKWVKVQKYLARVETLRESLAVLDSGSTGECTTMREVGGAPPSQPVWAPRQR
jgi:hypothetical protein